MDVAKARRLSIGAADEVDVAILHLGERRTTALERSHGARLELYVGHSVGSYMPIFFALVLLHTELSLSSVDNYLVMKR